MRLKFDLLEVMELLEHAKAAETHYRPYYPDDEDVAPGLVLVGDQGVYLMSNGRPAPNPQKIVYGIGTNPHEDDFNTWWDNKHSTFGGDDGAELLEVGSHFEEVLRTGVEDGYTKFVIDFVDNRLTCFVSK